MLQSNNPPRAPWVCNSDLLDHLSLLNAFHQLRTIRPEPEFLHMALFRFELWIGRLEILSPMDSPEKLPPLDVLMVWHAYCLGSRWYFEDSRRMYPILQIVDFPLALAATQYRRLRPKSKTLGVLIPDQAITNWFEMTNTIFDPVEYSETPSFRTTLCPACESAIETRFTNRAKEGWAESFKCKLRCDECGWKGQKSDLALHKLNRDLVSISSVPLLNLAEFDSLAGTLSTSKRLEDVGNAAQFNRLVSRLIKSSFKADLARDNLRSLDQGVALQIIKVLATLPKISKSEGVARIMNAYSVAEPFSLDLITYMKRQESFRNIIIHLGWGKAASSAAREDVEGASRKNFSGFAINRAASRYQAFVEVLRDSTAQQSIDICIPTYDIDLAWRTHQLKGVRYSQDMFHYLGRTIDHFTDRVHDTHTLDALFESTSKAWEKRYNVMYSQYPVPDLTIQKPYPLLKAILQEQSSHEAPLPNTAEKTKEQAGVDNVLQSMSIEPEQVVRFVIGGSPPVTIESIRAPASRLATEQEQRSKFGLSGVTCTNRNLEIDEGESGQTKIPDLLSGNVPRVMDVSIPQEEECWGEKVMKDLISLVDSSLNRPNNLADLSVVSEPRKIPDVVKSKHELAAQIKFEDDVTPEQDGAGVDHLIQKVPSLLGHHQQQRTTDLSLDGPTGTVIIPNVIKMRPDTASTGASELSCVSSSILSENDDVTPRPRIQITSIHFSPTLSIADSSSAATASVTENHDTIPRADPTPANYVTSVLPSSNQTDYCYSRARRLSESTAVDSVQSDSGDSANTVSGSRSRHDTNDHEVALAGGGPSVTRTQSKRVRIDEAELTKFDTPSHSARQLADAHEAPVPTNLRAHVTRKTSLPSISQLFRSSSTKAPHLRSRTESLKEPQSATCEGLGRIWAKQQDANSTHANSLEAPGKLLRNNRQLSRSQSMRTRNESRPTPRNTEAVTSESADTVVVRNQQRESPTPFKRPLPKSGSNVPPTSDDTSRAKRDELTNTIPEVRQFTASRSRQVPTFHNSRLPKRLLRPKDTPSDLQSACPARRKSKIPMLKSRSMPVESSQHAMTPTADSRLMKPSNGILKRGSSNPENSFNEFGGSSKESPTFNTPRHGTYESIKALKVSWGQDVGLSGRGLRKPKYLKTRSSKIEDRNQQQDNDDVVHDNDNENDDLERGSMFHQNLEGKLETKENEEKNEVKNKLEDIHIEIEPDVEEEKDKINLTSEELELQMDLNLKNSKNSVTEDLIEKQKASANGHGHGTENEEDYDEDSDGDQFSQLKVDIPIGRIGFVEGSKIRLLEPNHLMQTA